MEEAQLLREMENDTADVAFSSTDGCKEAFLGRAFAALDFWAVAVVGICLVAFFIMVDTGKKYANPNVSGMCMAG